MLKIEARIPFGRERLRSEPALKLRPHHFALDTVQYALLGLQNPRVLAAGFTEKLAEPETLDPAYEADVLGARRPLEIIRFQSGMEHILEKAEKLPGKGLVKMDLELDPICGGCSVGRHCEATNYMDGALHNVESVEQRIADEVVQDLVELGYVARKDFIREQTTHTMYDYGGRDLTQSSQAVPKRVTFSGLLVFAYALRDVASKRLKYPTRAEIRRNIWEWSGDHNQMG